MNYVRSPDKLQAASQFCRQRLILPNHLRAAALGNLKLLALPHLARFRLLVILAFLCVVGGRAEAQVNRLPQGEVKNPGKNTVLKDAELPAGMSLNWEKASVTKVNAKRELVSLDGVWRFIPAAEGTTEPPKVGWAYIKVPGSWQNSRAGSTDFLALGGGPQWDLYDGTRVARAWYRRQVPIPAEWQGRAISLNFDRVCTDAIVYVNGKECGRIAWP